MMIPSLAAPTLEVQTLWEGVRLSGLEALTCLGKTTIPSQPWLLLGLDTPLGLATTLAALESGLLRQGVGIYHVPNSWGGRDNTALQVEMAFVQEVAQGKGADLTLLVSTPFVSRVVTGELQDGPLPSEVLASLEVQRSAASTKDLIFVDATTLTETLPDFPPAKTFLLPTVNAAGHLIPSPIVEDDACWEVLRVLGGTHGNWLRELRKAGWWGARSVSLVFGCDWGPDTCAPLREAFRKSPLGRASLQIYNDVARLRIDGNGSVGYHTVVRGITQLSERMSLTPGGFLYALLLQQALEGDAPLQFAPLAVRGLAVALSEDSGSAEDLVEFVDFNAEEYGVEKRVAGAYQAIHDWLTARAGDASLPLDRLTTSALLAGFAPPDWQTRVSAIPRSRFLPLVSEPPPFSPVPAEQRVPSFERAIVITEPDVAQIREARTLVWQSDVGPVRPLSRETASSPLRGPEPLEPARPRPGRGMFQTGSYQGDVELARREIRAAYRLTGTTRTTALEKAIELLKGVLPHADTPLLILVDLGQAERLAGRYDDAIGHLKKACELRAHPRNLGELGTTYLESDRLDEAAAVALRMTRENPQDSMSWQFKAQVNLKKGEMKAALAAAEEGIRFGADFGRPYRLKAQALLMRAEPVEAELALKTGLARPQLKGKKELYEDLLILLVSQGRVTEVRGLREPARAAGVNRDHLEDILARRYPKGK